MITADGRIDPDELFSTGRLGSDLFPGFEADELERRCEAPLTVDEAAKLVPAIADLLEEGARSTLYRFLLASSQSDAEIAAEETELLDAVARSFR